MEENVNILLVGCGKMGGALAQRWVERRICKRLVVVEPYGAPQLPASDVWQHVVSFKDIPQGFVPQIIIFAVKPQTLPETLPDYQAYMAAGALAVSIAAGKPISFFEKYFGASSKIVRSMPNLPASIGQGVTVACGNAQVGVTEKKWTDLLLGAVGEVLWVGDENLLNPVTALSGSGPAYVFLLTETLTKAGINIGLEPVMAEKLARLTVIGSAALTAASLDISSATLRQNVTSPGGTTEAALGVLMAESAIQPLFDRALKAATTRAEELSG